MPSIKQSIQQGILPAEIFSDLSDAEKNKDMSGENITLLKSQNVQGWIKLKKFPISDFIKDYFGSLDNKFKKFKDFNPKTLIDQFNKPLDSEYISTLTAEQCLNISCLPLRNYLNNKLSFADIISLTENERNNLADPGVQQWISKGLNFQEARNLENIERYKITNPNITQFLSKDFTLSDIKALNYMQMLYITNPTINNLIKSGILNIKLLSKLNDDNVKGIVELSKANLLGTGENQFSLSEALEITKEQAQNLASDLIKTLIKSSSISKIIAINMQPHQRQNLESTEINSLINKGSYRLTIDQAMNLSLVERKMLEQKAIYSAVVGNILTIAEALKPLRDVEFYEYEIGNTIKKEKDVLFQKNLITNSKSELAVLLNDTNRTLEQNLKLKNIFLILLRFNPIATVKSIVEQFSTEYHNQREILNDMYTSAEQEFFSKAPYCSRLSNFSQLTALEQTYQHISVGNDSNITNLTNLVAKDLEYGQQRADLAHLLIQSLSEKSLSPTGSNFDKLPASAQGTKRVAALLEKIGTWNGNNNKIVAHLFSEIRNDKINNIGERARYTTPISGRYQWALPIIFSVSTYSKNINEEHSLTKPFYQSEKIYYNLSYTNPETEMASTLTSVYVDMYFSSYFSGYTSVWHHGQEAIKTTWPRIENLFETILNLDLKPPTSGADQKAYEDNLKDFYARTAEFVWLMGNTQPLCRGSGTVSEILLAVLHHHHGLQPPILKKEFPQLDVLNITIPLEDYKKLFTYFFEPETTPACVHYFDLSWSSLPIGKQMELAYKQINQDRPVLESKADKSYTANQSQTLFTAPKDNNNDKNSVSSTILETNRKGNKGPSP